MGSEAICYNFRRRAPAEESEMSIALLNPPVTGKPPLPGGNGIVVSEQDLLYEIIDGAMVEKPAMSVLSARIGMKLSAAIETYAYARKLGRAFMEAQFKFSSTARRTWRPDVAYVSYEQWGRDKPVPTDDPWLMIPDLVVEVQSPSNSDLATREKVEAYFTGGVREVWLIYPPVTKVYIYGSPTSVRVLQRGDLLDGGTVLPGFDIPLDLLFEDVQPDVF